MSHLPAPAAPIHIHTHTQIPAAALSLSPGAMEKCRLAFEAPLPRGLATQTPVKLPGHIGFGPTRTGPERHMRRSPRWHRHEARGRCLYDRVAYRNPYQAPLTKHTGGSCSPTHTSTGANGGSQWREPLAARPGSWRRKGRSNGGGNSEAARGGPLPCLHGAPLPRLHGRGIIPTSPPPAKAPDPSPPPWAHHGPRPCAAHRWGGGGQPGHMYNNLGDLRHRLPACRTPLGWAWRYLPHPVTR
jgi:hypothetical protein